MYARFVYHDFNCTVFLAAPDGHMFVGDQCYNIKASRLAVRRVEMTACRCSQLVLGLMDVLFLPEGPCYFNCEWQQGWLQACP